MPASPRSARAGRALLYRDTDRYDGARPERLECDLILSAGGHAPRCICIHRRAGNCVADESAMFVPEGAAPECGARVPARGIFDRDTAVSHAAELGARLHWGTRPPPRGGGGAGQTLPPPITRGGGKQFVICRRRLRRRRGPGRAKNYRSVSILKRYTTTGMGTDPRQTSISMRWC